MGEHLTRVGITEDKPRLTFVGHPAVGVEREAVVPHDRYQAMEMHKLVLRPISPTAKHIA